MDQRILEIAKKWAKDYGCEFIKYAGCEKGVHYFNGSRRGLEGGYHGYGASFAVLYNGKIKRIIGAKGWNIAREAYRLNQSYDLF